MAKSDIEPTGFDALNAKLAELAESDAEASEQESTEENEAVVASPEADASEEPKVDEAAPEKEEAVEEKPEAKSEIEAKVDEEVSEGEAKEAKEDNPYSPNYQYKFQDEMFDFDDRVKAAIKTPEDEEYFRDLYTKSRAMELMKTRAEETSSKVEEYKEKYESIESKATEQESMVNYFSSLLEGINRGDANAFNQLLSLSNANGQSLKNLGLVLAEHLENPQKFDSVVQRNQQQYAQQNMQRQTEAVEYQQAELARQKTELEVKKAISNPEISDIVEYVDKTWGAGTFEQRVWQEGEHLEARNKSVTFEEIPNIVKSVADFFGKARPSSPEAAEAPKARVETKIVNNPTHSLPQVRGGAGGVPEKPHYKEGEGFDSLRSKYKELTGEEW